MTEKEAKVRSQAKEAVERLRERLKGVTESEAALKARVAELEAALAGAGCVCGCVCACEIAQPFLKFDRHYSTSPVPQFADELLAAVRNTISKFCEQNGGENAEALRLFKVLQDEMFTHVENDDLSSSMAVSACLMWTSRLRLTLRDNGRSLHGVLYGHFDEPNSSRLSG